MVGSNQIHDHSQGKQIPQKHIKYFIVKLSHFDRIHKTNNQSSSSFSSDMQQKD